MTNNEQVMVNETQCQKIAAIIKTLEPDNDFYQREYLTLSAQEETKYRMHFFAVAICHHTYTLHHPMLDISGWDFIEHVFLHLAKEQTALLNPAFISKATVKEISKMLAAWFAHDDKKQACTLDRLDERAGLMLDAARKLIDRYDGSVKKLFDASGGFLRKEDSGLYEVMPEFEAFSDPLQKKSTFLIKLLMDAGMIEIKDPENFIPIMDYHMQRVLLRTGCVEVLDQALRDRLLTLSPMPTDEPVRSRCTDAFRIIARLSGRPVTRMNDYFWSLGRSCCNNTTLCHDGYCEKAPCTLSQIIHLDDHSKCIFEAVCPGAISLHYRRLWQPVVNTHFY
jgi:hypothetical protein